VSADGVLTVDSSYGPTLEDDALMKLCANGNEEALNALWRRYHSDVFNYALKVLGDRPGADEARQATFTALWRLSPRYVPSGKLRAYLMKIARTETREVAKGRRRWWSRLVESELYRPSTESAATDRTDAGTEQRERHAILRDALAALPDAQKEAVVMRYFADMAYDDIATAMERPVGTVRSLVFHAQKKLDGILRRKGIEGPSL
jgi:RNA polymerase sigma-70 factor (ECF subfamily)